MIIDEAADLLKILAAYDGRNVGEADLVVWGRQMADVEAVDAMEAVHQHYNETRDWAYPADIRAIAVRLRNRRNRRPEVVAPGCYEPDEEARRRLVPNADGTRALALASVPRLILDVPNELTDEEAEEWSRRFREAAASRRVTVLPGPTPDQLDQAHAAGYATAVANLRDVAQRTGSPASRWAADYLEAVGPGAGAQVEP